MSKFSEADLRRITERVEFFSNEYFSEVPMRIHSRGTDDGHGLGGPPFHPEFINWLQAGDDKERAAMRSDMRQRITRVFRKIRKVAPREYFVLQLVCTHRLDILEVTNIMNARAIAGGHPERYDPTGVTVLLAAALDKAEKWMT